jgi:hypothetical protein
LPSINRTFRLNKEWDQKLQEEAKKRRIGVSTLLNHIVSKFINFEILSESFSSITFANSTFLEFIELLNDKELENVAKKYGKIMPNQVFLRNGIQAPNLRDILSFICVFLGEYANWFKCNSNIKKNIVNLQLYHQRGKKWSLFISNYLEVIIEQFLKTKPKIIIETNSTLIQFITTNT